MRINRVEDEEAWKKARELTQTIYRISDEAGFDDDHNLRRQLRQAATSTMANIAEGFESGTDREFIRFLRIAKRSAAEVQSHLYVANDRGYLPTGAFEAAYAKCEETKRLIGGFIRYLGKRRKRLAPHPEPPVGS